jgi:hypothetical protein
MGNLDTVVDGTPGSTYTTAYPPHALSQWTKQ